MNACSQYWNACLPLATNSLGRNLLCNSLLELLSLVATFMKKKNYSECCNTLLSSCSDQGHDVLIAMYGIALQAFADEVGTSSIARVDPSLLF